MSFLSHIQEGMKGFGTPIGSLVTSVLLLVVYIAGVGVTSLLGRVFGKKFLNVRSSGSSWMVKEQGSDWYHQF